MYKEKLIFLSEETIFVKKREKTLQKSDRMLKKLPIEKDVETKKVLKKLETAHRTLTELKSVVSTIPNENILINTLVLQEAKDSSAIENIITTHDDIYKADLNLEGFKSLTAKEVQNYISALKKSFTSTFAFCHYTERKLN